MTDLEDADGHTDGEIRIEHGYVEFSGLCLGAEGVFVGGWLASELQTTTSDVIVSAQFERATLYNTLRFVTYRREDVDPTGIGFLVIFHSEAKVLGNIRCLDVRLNGETISLLPTSAFVLLEQNSILSQLQHVVPWLGADPTYDEVKTTIFGRAAIDHVVRCDGITSVEGWILGSSIGLEFDFDGQYWPAQIRLYRRPDVEAGFNVTSAKVFGFIAIAPDVGPSKQVRMSYSFSYPLAEIRTPPAEFSREELDQLAARNVSRLGFLMEVTAASEIWSLTLTKLIQAAPLGFTGACGHLEEAKGIRDIGGLVVGWSVCDPAWQCFLVSSTGRLHSLQSASRWHRGDVVEAYGSQFGALTFDAGFLTALIGPFDPEERIQLIATRDEQAFRLSEVAWQPAPLDPASYARWAFDFPDPLSQFRERVPRHDRVIIDELLARRNEALRRVGCETVNFGTPHTAPICSMIIPVFGRFDFIMHQMMEFAEDESIRTAELIYVVDDPRIRSSVLDLGALIFAAYGIPFKVLLSPVNRGFAAATNLGVRHSRSARVLLLNSDVIPQKSGWLAKMLQALDGESSVGLVGARLLAANSSVQHDGMDFEWDASWGVHLNKHPGAGYPPSLPSNTPVARLAVTAACALISRDLYDAVGGLDEGFLIGDFEDSDLCLKVIERGLNVVCVQDVHLVHLERQSFAGIGSGRFREALARFNGLRHEQQWGPMIKKLVSSNAIAVSWR